MALAAPILEQTYRYPFPSGVVGEDSAPAAARDVRWPGGEPAVLPGALLQPVVAADLLLTLGDVARSRFHVPAAMLTRILELADPVATCADDRLRFEAFSACCSVYGRVDLLPEAYDGETLGRGTTNVDFGPAIRAALAGVQDGAGWSCPSGAAAVEVETDAASAVERRVPLPSRWLRGFLEVQAIQAELAPGGRARRRGDAGVPPLDPEVARRSGRSGSRRPVAACGRSTTIPGPGAVGLAGWPASACSTASPGTRRRCGSSPRPGTAAPAGSSTSRALA